MKVRGKQVMYNIICLGFVISIMFVAFIIGGRIKVKAAYPTTYPNKSAPIWSHTYSQKQLDTVSTSTLLHVIEWEKNPSGYIFYYVEYTISGVTKRGFIRDVNVNSPSGTVPQASYSRIKLLTLKAQQPVWYGPTVFFSKIQTLYDKNQVYLIKRESNDAWFKVEYQDGTYMHRGYIDFARNDYYVNGTDFYLNAPGGVASKNFSYKIDSVFSDRYVNAINAAVNKWNDITGGRDHIPKSHTISYGYYSTNIVKAVYETGFNGRHVPLKNGYGTVVGFEILLSLSNLSDDTDLEIQGTVAHEFGHALGLGHIANKPYILNPKRNRSQIYQRQLADIAGAWAFYNNRR